MREPWGLTWRRRAVTIPFIFLLGSLVLATLPLTLLAGVGFLVFERKRGSALRVVGFFAGYLVGEMIILTVAALEWVFGLGWLGTAASNERMRRWANWLGNTWGSYLHHLGWWFFRIRCHPKGLEVLEAGGPVIVMLRHTSVGDVVFAPVFIGIAAGLQLRYVAKNELRGDPAFDVIGGRLGSCWVKRSSDDPAREIDNVCHLLESFGRDQAIVLFPEGTRFTPTKRNELRGRLAGRLPPDLVVQARALRNLLPPRLGGPVALLERNPGADVILVNHAGYEGASTFSDLIEGRAVGAQVKVEFRRVAYADLPKGREALTHWLFDRWTEMDAWIDANHPLGMQAEADEADEAVAVEAEEQR